MSNDQDLGVVVVKNKRNVNGAAAAATRPLVKKQVERFSNPPQKVTALPQQNMSSNPPGVVKKNGAAPGAECQRWIVSIMGETVLQKLLDQSMDFTTVYRVFQKPHIEGLLLGINDNQQSIRLFKIEDEDDMIACKFQLYVQTTFPGGSLSIIDRHEIEDVGTDEYLRAVVVTMGPLHGILGTILKMDDLAKVRASKRYLGAPLYEELRASTDDDAVVNTVQTIFEKQFLEWWKGMLNTSNRFVFLSCTVQDVGLTWHEESQGCVLTWINFSHPQYCAYAGEWWQAVSVLALEHLQKFPGMPDHNRQVCVGEMKKIMNSKNANKPKALVKEAQRIRRVFEDDESLATWRDLREIQEMYFHPL